MLIEKNNMSRGSIIQAIYRSNLVIMGMPLAAGIYGDGNVGDHSGNGFHSRAAL